MIGRFKTHLLVLLVMRLMVGHTIQITKFDDLSSCKATNEVFHTGQVCHIWCNFKPGYTFWITIIFGTPKYGSLKVNSLLSIIISATETSYKMASMLCQKWNLIFLLKSSNFVHFEQYDLVTFSII